VHADRGMSGERTSIAWDRTALTVLTGVMVVARLNLERLTPLALAFLAVTLGAALEAVLIRPTADEVGRPMSRSRPDGRRPVLVALAVFGLAASELAAAR
jgi:uncharacterized membrane protein YidH (DUF202 family)